jgi:uncharacterized RDD family membrane protein YckC
MFNLKITMCNTCYWQYVWKRLSAAGIDMALVALGIVGISVFSYVWLGGNPDPALEDTLINVQLLVLFICILVRDSFNGCSPGKAWAGLQVVDVQTGIPGGVWKSIKRNIHFWVPLLVPLEIILIMTSGSRLGDRTAHTQVIWGKYRDKPPFKIPG